MIKIKSCAVMMTQPKSFYSQVSLCSAQRCLCPRAGTASSVCAALCWLRLCQQHHSPTDTVLHLISLILTQIICSETETPSMNRARLLSVFASPESFYTSEWGSNKLLGGMLLLQSFSPAVVTADFYNNKCLLCYCEFSVLHVAYTHYKVLMHK